MKRHSASLTITEIKVKITFRFHFARVSVAIVKKKMVTKANEEVRKEESLGSVGRSVN